MTEKKRWHVVVHGERLPSPDSLLGCLVEKHRGLLIVERHDFPPPKKTFYTIEASGEVEADQIKEVVSARLQQLGAATQTITVCQST